MIKMTEQQVEQSYQIARELYGQMGVDTEQALKIMQTKAISLHCWQGDDVTGLEANASGLSGDGIQATGNYPGKPRNGDELRQDIDQAMSLIPGTLRLNLHAFYCETGGKFVARDQLETKHFQKWIDWAKQNKIGLDFNGTFFSHPKVVDGFSLASPDKAIRDFWIAHAQVCRHIAADMARALGIRSVVDLWIPDGFKDLPADRWLYRQYLKESLDAIFADKVDPTLVLDAVEAKLFGIGSEAYVVGSHEFYLAYAAQNKMALCLDSGHFHPTEKVSDKISSVLTFIDELLLHVTRGIRWDSDHVVNLEDETRDIFLEIIRGNALNRVNIALDFFDASINRIAAWVIGTRAAQKALLYALVDPSRLLKEYELAGDWTSRLALMEDLKTMPFGAVYDYFCLKSGTIPGNAWMAEVKKYEREVLAQR
ncbi:L-rhamnose isomerase [candidate division KSB1 bacterium]|nr:L-rhamnose isomerase [candidate division KSB1 bacterium]